MLKHKLDREQSQIGFISSKKNHIFLQMCVTCSELPSNISTMHGIEFERERNREKIRRKKTKNIKYKKKLLPLL